MEMTTLVGGFAAFCTTVSYFPQLKKCWDTGETGDLSTGMLLFLIVGLSAWVAYGVRRSDIVIIIANMIDNERPPRSTLTRYRRAFPAMLSYPWRCT